MSVITVYDEFGGGGHDGCNGGDVVMRMATVVGGVITTRAMMSVFLTMMSVVTVAMGVP